jgi:hypothetical protein
MRSLTALSVVALLLVIGVIACAAPPNPGTIHTSGEKPLQGDAGPAPGPAPQDAAPAPAPAPPRDAAPAHD